MSDSTIMWKEGLLRGPSGKQMRQVPQKHPWTSSLWCSADGELIRRFYSVSTKQWHWDSDGPLMYSEDATGALGIYLDDAFKPIATVIALAWLHRAPDSQARSQVQEGQPVQLDTIRWADAESNEEESSIPGEKWSPLKHWYCGAIPVPAGYMISTKGRLKNKEGAVTKGFWFSGASGGTRLAAIADCGLVDLWVCAKLIPAVIELKPCIMNAADALMNDMTAQHLATARQISKDTAWNYMRQAAVHLPRKKLRQLGPTLTSRDLWNLLVDMRERGDDIDGIPLKTLMENVQDELSDDGTFARRGWEWGELAFARMSVVAHG